MTTTPADSGGWDVHTHLVPLSVVRAAQQSRFGLETADGHLLVRSSRLPLGRLVQPPKLLEWLSANGLKGAIVSPPPPLFRPDLRDADRSRWAALVNDGMRELCERSADTLRPMAYLPAEAPALAEAIAAGLDDSWAGVTVGTELCGRSYSELEYDRLWTVLADRRLPVFLHPGTCPDQRLEPFYLTNLLGNPYETTVAAAHLLFGGALDRFSDLRVLLAHGGGVLASVVARWQRGFDTSRPGVPILPAPPSQVVRRFWVDSLVHSRQVLDLVIEIFGIDHVLFGSDWPFPMGADSVGGLAHMSDSARTRIRCTNVQLAFGSRVGDQLGSANPSVRTTG